MSQDLRGIAVLDIGATSSKLALFDADLKPLAERKIASRHAPGPPYAHIDPEPVFAGNMRNDRFVAIFSRKGIRHG